jgi:hypothetical protein
MKKITRIFALALALVMAFALQAPVNAAEKAAVPEWTEKWKLRR